EEGEPEVARALRTVHGDVGIAQQVVRAGVLGRAEDDADAGPDAVDLAIEREGWFERLGEALADLDGFVGIGHFAEERGKLVATKPGQGVALAEAAAEA